MLNQKKHKILAGVVLLLVAAIAVKAVFLCRGMGTSVVYLSTGEAYVGDLYLFPKMQLKNGYILTTVKDPVDPNKTTFQLNPLKEALWAPKNLYINRKHVVFYGPIMSDSKIAQTLAEQEK